MAGRWGRTCCARWAELAVVVALALALAGPTAAPEAARAASAGDVPILTYHRVGSSPRFARQVAALARHGYSAVTLGRVWQAWRGEAGLPRRPVVLTFDDGYLSHYHTAARTLRARGWPGVLNLQTGRLGRPGGLSAPQVRRMLADGWELDAHSVTHPDLTKVGSRRLTAEVAGSRRAIRDAFGVQASFFAYPFGRHDARVRRAVRAAGFLGATSVRRGLASPRQDPFALDRITVAGRTSPHALVASLG
jgi:peptidoglycan/xylan/chitin deacetylase (PgdA/CDA1 family)